jgi:hypothetical protein
MICSPFGRADFTAFAVLHATRSETPRLHGLRLAYAANSARENYRLMLFSILLKEHLNIWQLYVP